MTISYQIQDDILIIMPLEERLDAHAAPAFKEEVTQLLEAHDYKNVIFDLHHLQFIDSSGLGTFLSFLRTLHNKKGALKLASMNKPIRTVFELVAMHKIFAIFNTTQDAVHSFGEDLS